MKRFISREPKIPDGQRLQQGLAAPDLLQQGVEIVTGLGIVLANLFQVAHR